ncbi:hypothetical protein EDC01DRAFT_636179 [Geopyxis carbonaria]|nr:hypothetical protein EDC01DRAFT_636179 [Geopyxis carbonaria]
MAERPRDWVVPYFDPVPPPSHEDTPSDDGNLGPHAERTTHLRTEDLAPLRPRPDQLVHLRHLGHMFNPVPAQAHEETPSDDGNPDAERRPHLRTEDLAPLRPRPDQLGHLPRPGDIFHPVPAQAHEETPSDDGNPDAERTTHLRTENLAPLRPRQDQGQQPPQQYGGRGEQPNQPQPDFRAPQFPRMNVREPSQIPDVRAPQLPRMNVREPSQIPDVRAPQFPRMNVREPSQIPDVRAPQFPRMNVREPSQIPDVRAPQFPPMNVREPSQIPDVRREPNVRTPPGVVPHNNWGQVWRGRYDAREQPPEQYGGLGGYQPQPDVPAQQPPQQYGGLGGYQPQPDVPAQQPPQQYGGQGGYRPQPDVPAQDRAQGGSPNQRQRDRERGIRRSERDAARRRRERRE